MRLRRILSPASYGGTGDRPPEGRLRKEGLTCDSGGDDDVVIARFAQSPPKAANNRKCREATPFDYALPKICIMEKVDKHHSKFLIDNMRHGVVCLHSM